MKEALRVSEQFLSIQGEGPTAGCRAVFLRLQGCNLVCGGRSALNAPGLHDGATWRCDTLDVWQKGTLYSFESLLNFWDEKGWLSQLQTGAHLVITGGEPLLSQDRLLAFLDLLSARLGLNPYIEIETNGTILPLEGLFDRVSQWNVSPKLQNSGMPLSLRLVPEVMARFLLCPVAFFKWVVSEASDLEDIQEVFVQPFKMPASRVFLMPGADSAVAMTALSPQVVQWCLFYGYSFSPRLHLWIWDQKTGV